MSQIFSFAQIQVQFDSEWVLVQNPETSESLEVMRGEVLYHSKSRDDVYQTALELKPKHTAILFTGFLPENTVVVL